VSATPRPGARTRAIKPVLFVTGHVPAYRVGALAALHEREHLELALFGGRAAHGGEAFAGELPFPHRHVGSRELYALASSRSYRAVVCPTGGRLALLAAWSGARRARVPLILWASLWAHPRTAAHALSYVPLRRLYRSADAVVTYGPHVSAYVAARGARNVFIAPQSVDNGFWRAGEPAPPHDPRWGADARVRFLFIGRPVPEKGLDVLLSAWRAAGLAPPAAALALVLAHDPGARPPARAGKRDGATGEGDAAASEQASGVVRMHAVPAIELRDLYAEAHVLVVPSIATRTFREPWGLVINEAMNKELAVIASDAVGAAAGGLVRDGATGLVVRAGDVDALAGALARLAGDAALRARLGAAGAEDVLAFSHSAWAQGFSQALASLGLARER
jgi:glycosyltransferase involved in cell wall biosynthesis